MLFCNLNITKNLVVLKKLWLKKAENEYEASFWGALKTLFGILRNFHFFTLFREGKCPKMKNKREKSTPRRPRPGHTFCPLLT